MNVSKAHAAYLKKLSLKTKARPLAEYAGARVKLRHRCGCGSVWSTSPSVLLSSKTGSCRKCSDKIRHNAKRLSHESIQRRLRDVHKTDVQMVGMFRGTNLKHRFRCNVCDNSWKALLNNVLRGTGCPRCGKKDAHKNLRNTGKLKTVVVGGVQFKVQGYEPQAIEWIVRNTKIKAEDILVDRSGQVPTIVYKIGRRTRSYFPDMFVPKRNIIVEVKSTYTLGLDTGRDWRKNQAKAKAVIAEGYKFVMMVMDAKGGRMFKMPSDWYARTRLSVLTEIANQKADVLHEGVKSNRRVHTKPNKLAEIILDAIAAVPKPRTRRDVLGAVVDTLKGIV